MDQLEARYTRTEVMLAGTLSSMLCTTVSSWILVVMVMGRLPSVVLKPMSDELLTLLVCVRLSLATGLHKLQLEKHVLNGFLAGDKKVYLKPC